MPTQPGQTYWEWIRANFSDESDDEEPPRPLGPNGRPVEALRLGRGVEPLLIPWTRVPEYPMISYTGTNFADIPHGTVGNTDVVELGMVLVVRHPARVPHGNVVQLIHSLSAVALATRVVYDPAIHDSMWGYANEWESYYWLATVIRSTCVAIGRLDLLADFNAIAPDPVEYVIGPPFYVHGMGLAAAACYPQPRDHAEICQYLRVVGASSYEALIDTQLVHEEYPDDLIADIEINLDWPDRRNFVMRQVARGDVWCLIPGLFTTEWWTTPRDFPFAVEVIESAQTPNGISPIAYELAAYMSDDPIEYLDEWGGTGGLLARLGRALIALASVLPPANTIITDRFITSESIAQLWYLAILSATSPDYIRARALLMEFAPLATALQTRYAAGDLREIYAENAERARKFFLNARLPVLTEGVFNGTVNFALALELIE
jgi:hypothetical protein